MDNKLSELLERWGTDGGRPFKESLIDWEAYEGDPNSIGCMCAQGQVLHVLEGWSASQLLDTDQALADAKVAEILNISVAHSVLLRHINDRVDGAPAITLTDPEQVLGDQWSKLLDFWWMLDHLDEAVWAAFWAAARAAFWAAAGVAARAAAGDAARDAARAAAGDAAGVAARDAAEVAARDAAWEIQGFELLKRQGRDVFFLPMFGVQTLEDIPARPVDYGHGVVPSGEE